MGSNPICRSMGNNDNLLKSILDSDLDFETKKEILERAGLRYPREMEVTLSFHDTDHIMNPYHYFNSLRLPSNVTLTVDSVRIINPDTGGYSFYDPSDDSGVEMDIFLATGNGVLHRQNDVNDTILSSCGVYSYGYGKTGVFKATVNMDKKFGIVNGNRHKLCKKCFN